MPKLFTLTACLLLFGLLVLSLLVLPTRVAGQATDATDHATGYVYHDRNQNGQRDPGEPGIAGVAVSNGEEVVATDQQGQYRLSVDGDATLFVIKPSGWRPPVNESNLPQFYYIHKPEGSPELEYAGSAPTGPLPPSIDFPLYSQPEPERFKILVFGDPQPYSLTQVDYLAGDIVDELAGGKGAALGITLGDNVGDDLSLFQPLNAAIAKIGIPWYSVLGNHDINFDVEHDHLADETFERVFGPSTYAFTYGQVHFIVLDNVIYPAGDSGFARGLREDQLAFIENYLEHVPEEGLVVLAMHIPLTGIREADRRQLFALLESFPHTLSLSAHTHRQNHRFFGSEAGWRQPDAHHHYNVGTTSGSWWNGIKDETGIPHTMMRDGTPNGYAFISFEGNEYKIDYQVARRPANYRMNIWSPPVFSKAAKSPLRLMVNVFNGSEKTDVAYRIGVSSEWIRMGKIDAVDPYYAALYKRWQHFEKLDLLEERQRLATEVLGHPLPKPRKSRHLWQALLPSSLSVGRHRVEVRVKDMFGRTFIDNHTFRVVE